MNDKNLYDELFNSPQNPEFFKDQKVGLSRSSTNVIVTGVCAGIAKYINKDVKIIRLITLLLLLFGWFPFFVYLILGFLLPVEKQNVLLTKDEFVLINKENSKIILGSIIFLIGFHFALINIGAESFLNSYIFQNKFITFSFALILGGMIFSDKIKLPVFYNESYNLLTISKNKKMILGVCEGFSNYLSVDVLIIRIIFSILFFLTLGLFTIFYLMTYFFFKISADRIND